ARRLGDGGRGRQHLLFATGQRDHRAAAGFIVSGAGARRVAYSAAYAAASAQGREPDHGGGAGSGNVGCGAQPTDRVLSEPGAAELSADYRSAAEARAGAGTAPMVGPANPERECRSHSDPDERTKGAVDRHKRGRRAARRNAQDERSEHRAGDADTAANP